MKKYVPIILLTVTGCAVLGDILFTPQDILNNYKKEYILTIQQDLSTCTF